MTRVPVDPTPVQTYLPTPSATRLRLPDNACDAHVHVFGPPARFPYASTRNFTPVAAPKETLFALHRQLGITRCVIVQSMIHGMDNAVVANAIAAGQGRYLGVALAPVEVTATQLQDLAAQGFRAVRFNFMKHLGMGTDPQALVKLTHRLADAQMHLQVHFEASMVNELAPWLQRSAVPVVIDHMGRVDATESIQGAHFQSLCRLLDQEAFHVKISGIDRVNEKLPLSQPPYEQGKVLARHLLARFPKQCVWGTDWPHPNHTHIPDDGALVDALVDIAPTPEALQALLVDNPERLYRFSAFEKSHWEPHP